MTSTTNSGAADFEDEIQALNLDHDLIFSQYSEACSRELPTPLEGHRRYSPNKMKIITKVNEITGQKPIGELPTHSDWDEQDSVEKETIALMRKFGLEQSVDRRPDEKRTISTIPTTEDVITMRNGHKKMSIFMSESFFELKPRSSPTFCLDDEPASLAESNTFTSETTLSSQLSSSSTTEIAPNSNVDYNYVSSNNTTSTSSTQSDLSWTRMSADSNESSTGWNCHVKYSNKLREKNRKPLADGNSNRRSNQKSSKELKTKEGEKQTKSIKNSAHNLVKKEPVKDAVKVEEENVPKFVPNTTTNCEKRFYTPRDLFLKKKAIRIQQVLAANQS